MVTGLDGDDGRGVFHCCHSCPEYSVVVNSTVYVGIQTVAPAAVAYCHVFIATELAMYCHGHTELQSLQSRTDQELLDDFLHVVTPQPYVQQLLLPWPKDELTDTVVTAQ